MKAEILLRPDTFDRVDRVKEAVGQTVRDGDDRFWILGGPLVVTINEAPLTIPQGFTTDGASIPRVGQILTGWDPWEPPQRWAAICHDWCYTQAGITKRFADDAFKAVLISEGATVWQRTVMHAAVVLFGGSAYRIDQFTGPRIYNKR